MDLALGQAMGIHLHEVRRAEVIDDRLHAARHSQVLADVELLRAPRGTEHGGQMRAPQPPPGPPRRQPPPSPRWSEAGRPEPRRRAAPRGKMIYIQVILGGIRAQPAD